MLGRDRPPTDTGDQLAADAGDGRPTKGRPATNDHDRGELVAQLRSEVERLERLLGEANEARRRTDHLMAGMIEDRRALAARVAELEAGAAAGGDAPVAAQNAPGATEAADPPIPPARPWWRRLVGR